MSCCLHVVQIVNAMTLLEVVEVVEVVEVAENYAEAGVNLRTVQDSLDHLVVLLAIAGRLLAIAGRPSMISGVQLKLAKEKLDARISLRLAY